jgi:hypothetical protein
MATNGYWEQEHEYNGMAISAKHQQICRGYPVDNNRPAFSKDLARRFVVEGPST